MVDQTTTRIHASKALTPHGWMSDVVVTVQDGVVVGVAPGVPDVNTERVDVLLQAMPNLHSHAFQRAMAGRAEMRGATEDNFWSWRETMYSLALSMTPDDVEAVAAQLYVEMLEAGFGRVGEFHYLHHAGDGRPYANIAEMAERIVGAAKATGIGLTLLPVFYAHSGFGDLPPLPGQRRFINDLDSFGSVLEASVKAVAGLQNGCVGIAPHSLRAVTPEHLVELQKLGRGRPIHIHIAEQEREVADCLVWSRARPVEWLLANVPVDSSWCLIHATHMTDAETLSLAATDAVVGLCPITEANLGDGTFPAQRFLDAGGVIGVGSDSNVLIGVAEELRQLEYSQRLAFRRRTVLAATGGSNGRALFAAASSGGNQALGARAAGIAEGCAADFMGLSPRLGSVMEEPDASLDAWIFANGALVECVWANGRKVVSDGRHFARDAIAKRFDATMRLIAERAYRR